MPSLSSIDGSMIQLVVLLVVLIQLTGDYDEKYIKANHLEESAKWKLRVGSEDYLAATVDVFPPGVPDDDQLEKKKRSGKAKKARLANLAVNFGSADEVAVAICKKKQEGKDSSCCSGIFSFSFGIFQGLARTSGFNNSARVS